MLHPLRFPLTLALAAAVLWSIVGTARAAESFDACQGRFIDSLPVSITTQGVWCLRKDLTTSITNGSAITIATNNVTIDCNDFKIGGLGAGINTNTKGILVQDRLNATVRNCGIRGFLAGVWIAGSQQTSAGHVIEDNRFSDNTAYGIYVEGDGSVVERNKVLDTGGSGSNPGQVYGIYTVHAVDVLDNLISNLAAAPNGAGAGSSFGIQSMYGAGTIADNRVRGLSVVGTGTTGGIFVWNIGNNRTTIRNNDLVGPGVGDGVVCFHANGLAHSNTISGFGTAVNTCTDGGNHLGP